MQCFFFPYFKLGNNLEVLVSLSNTLSNNSYILFSTSSFNLSVSIISSFSGNFDSLSFSKSCGFSKNLYLSYKVVKFTSNFSKI